MPEVTFDYVRRYASTLRHIKPWQVVGRLVVPIVRRRAVRGARRVPDGLERRGMMRAEPPQHEPWNTTEALMRGEFCFLRDDAQLGWPPNWEAPGQSLLWQFNLHYFNYLHLLPREEQIALCRDWLRAHPPGAPVAWHPYPTSLRIVNWCRAGVDTPDLLAGLYRQAAYLSRHMETYVYGNHLLENARALVMAGAYFGEQGEAPRWLERGLDVYRRETEEQILADGGHYERSPMYHAIMLEGYLDVLNVLPDAHPDRSWLQDTVRSMADVLVSLTHPDGQLALFNDATQEIAPSTARLVTYVRDLLGYEPVPRSEMAATGYLVHGGGDLYLAIDGGPVAPDHLMAHAHADVFSFVASVSGVQMIVDTGVYEYPAGPMRDYVRSTPAHNTVSVDGVDQVECWDSFRVGLRRKPEDVRFERTETTSRFEGTFRGYADLIGDGIVHHRTVDVDETERVVTVTDRVDGVGSHLVESYVHLHPEAHVERTPEGLRVQREGASCKIRVPDQPWRLEKGWYCPCFGERVENDVLVVGERRQLPVALTYEICY